VSSTSRGGKRSVADFYATPSWAVHRFLERISLPGGLWLECAAGEGAIIDAVNEVRSDVLWTAMEKREKCCQALAPRVAGTGHLLIGDTLKTQLSPEMRAVIKATQVSISNYPFSLAMEFIEWSLASNIPWVISLLRLNYLGTEDRNEFFQNNMPDVYVIPDRVSFAISMTCMNKRKGCKWGRIVAISSHVRIPKQCPKCGHRIRVSSADSIEYAWFCWGPERNRKVGELHVLNHTPLDVRKGLLLP